MINETLELERQGKPSEAIEYLSRSIDAARNTSAPLPRGARMDLRTYGIGAQILRALGVGKMKLLANPRKMPSMAGFNLEVTGYQAGPTEH